MTRQSNVELPMEIESEDERVMVSFWWTGTLLKKAARRFFRQHGSSEAQFNLLKQLLHEPGPMTQNDLSKKLLVDKSNVTGLLDGMAGSNLVKRNPVPGDRRSYHVTLTPAGRKTVEELDKLYGLEIRRITAIFSSKDRKDLLRLTKKLRVSLAELGL